MRVSRPMPRATSATSASTSSQTFAISLMNEILVARNAFEASLISSDEAMSVMTISSVIGAYSSASRDAETGSAAPTTTRSGCMKSASAEPSRRNSGFEA